MDSLTQIVLGAAAGELAAGRKIGNRAMFIGAIGGTLPDLDIIANAFTDDITALAMHRGFSHSFVFAGLMPWGLAWLSKQYFDRGYHQSTFIKGLFMVLTMLFIGSTGMLPSLFNPDIGSLPLIITTISALLVGTWLYYEYFTQDMPSMTHISYRTYWLLWFWPIFTHPLLDSFTAYGTQLFQPFSNYRVAFNTISVVDPLYTLPFMLCLILACWWSRQSSTRRRLVLTGVAISSVYLIGTMFNKHHINQTFAKSLAANNIPYQRFTTLPTIFNNILWNCTAETDEHLYFGAYSMLDKPSSQITFIEAPKNHDLLPDSRDGRILDWFSDGYYNLLPYHGDTLQFNNAKFGVFSADNVDPSNYIFKFKLDTVSGKAYNFRDFDQNDNAFSDLWERIKGID